MVWRAGLDLNPLDVTNPSDVAWLDALIWPEHEVLSYAALPAPPGDILHNVLALDGIPLAWTRPHGQALTWLN